MAIYVVLIITIIDYKQCFLSMKVSWGFSYLNTLQLNILLYSVKKLIKNTMLLIFNYICFIQWNFCTDLIYIYTIISF